MQLRSDHYAILIALALANAIAKPVAGWLFHGLAAPNPVTVLCAAAGLVVWWRQSDHPITISVSMVLAPVAVLLLVPSSFAAWIATALLSGNLLAQRNWSPRARLALLVLTVAALRTPIAESAMSVLSNPLLALDAWLANIAGAVVGGGGELNHNMIFGADGHAVLVMSGCASFANVSNALLVWFTTVSLMRFPTRLSLVVAGSALTLAIVGINAARLGAMTISRDTYAYVHDGYGATISELAMTASILIATVLVLLAPEKSHDEISR